MAFNSKFAFLLILLSISFTFQHGGHMSEDDVKETPLSKFLTSKIKNFSKLQQANIGAFIISSAPIPIFFLIVLFRITNKNLLDIMSSFAAGALIGDVFIHNLPEIFEHDHEHHHSKHSLFDLMTKNEILICWGVLLLFTVEKIMNLFSPHSHHHHEDKLNTSNVAISLLGDFIHNLTDGMAIGAGYNKSLKIGITLSLSIFFHEIPHEVGDFSYLLKQNMNIGSALGSQLFSAIGGFVLVEAYSNQIISFASGAFLYLAINTIMGDLKESKSIATILLEVAAFGLGVWFLLIAL